MKLPNFSFISALWIFLFCFHPVYSQAPLIDCGTLIITYHTPQGSEKLDRIRFWLIDEHEEYTLYPKKDECVTNSHSENERTVVITQLPIGIYQIHFLIPNTDSFYEPIPNRQVVVKNEEVVKVDQPLYERHAIPPVTTTQSTSHDTLEFLESKTKICPVIPNKNLFSLSPIKSTPIEPALKALFSLDVNQNATWKLVHQNQIIYSSHDPVEQLEIPVGKHYMIVAESIPGYTFAPPEPFDIGANEEIKIELDYQKDQGRLHLSGQLPASLTTLSFVLQSQDEENKIEETLNAIERKIDWTSPFLPIGIYTLTYSVPFSYIAPDAQTIKIEKNGTTHLILSPIHEKGKILITTDNEEAIFILNNENGQKIGEGKGLSKEFNLLEPGQYLITYAHPDSNLRIPPEEKVTVSLDEITKVNASFARAGTLDVTIKEPTHLILAHAKDKKEIINQIITEPTTHFTLPEGHYLLTYYPANKTKQSSKTFYLTIHTLLPRQIELSSFSISPNNKHSASVLKEVTKAGIDITTNLNEASFTIHPTNSPSTSIYKGKQTFISLNKEGEYLVTFNSVPNYKTPAPIMVKREANDYKSITAFYAAEAAFTEVPGGDQSYTLNKTPVITKNNFPTFLPPFQIAVYPTTNIQFADWLTQAFFDKVVTWDPKNKGCILDKDGHLICKTHEANPLAQLTADSSKPFPQVIPLEGKESYPVIEVSWYGAKAYCQTYHYRLPTEQEWEKAAGISIPKSHSIPHQFKYGFTENIIDRTWANYLDSTRLNKNSRQVLTNPVGFYNGVHQLPLMLTDLIPAHTNNAKSPCGAYDMSGNVWEWIEDEDNQNTHSLNFKIVKGGCYQSPEQELQVSARTSFPPDYSDIYTGFRVVK